LVTWTPLDFMGRTSCHQFVFTLQNHVKSANPTLTPRVILCDVNSSSGRKCALSSPTAATAPAATSITAAKFQSSL
jgi:hypothetical protein